MASFIILSAELTPADLQRFVGLQADRTWDLGDPTGPTGRGRQRYNGWRIDVVGDEVDAESGLLAILSRVREVADRIRKIAIDARVHSASIWVFSAGGHFGIDLKPEVLHDLANLGVTLRINAYGLDDGRDTGGGDQDNLKPWPRGDPESSQARQIS